MSSRQATIKSEQAVLDGPATKPVPLEEIPFHEELTLPGGMHFNYYYALLLTITFPKTYMLERVLDIIKACRNRVLSSEEVKRRCRRFKSSDMKKHCQKALETFYTPYKPCFLQEERDKRILRQKGAEIVNAGNHGTDLLLILNRIRGGRIKDEKEVSYYVKRFQLYAEVHWNEWKSFLKAADSIILEEWHSMSVNPNKDDF